MGELKKLGDIVAAKATEDRLAAEEAVRVKAAEEAQERAPLTARPEDNEYHNGLRKPPNPNPAITKGGPLNKRANKNGRKASALLRATASKNENATKETAETEAAEIEAEKKAAEIEAEKKAAKIEAEKKAKRRSQLGFSSQGRLSGGSRPTTRKKKPKKKTKSKRKKTRKKHKNKSSRK